MIFHIDMANQYHQRTFSVLAMVGISDVSCIDQIKRGIVITDPLRKVVLKSYPLIYIHASLISMLLDEFLPISLAIICPDVRPIKRVISLVCDLSLKLRSENLKSLFEYRRDINSPFYRSDADAFACNIKRNFIKRNNWHNRRAYFNDSTVKIISRINSRNYFILKEKLRRLIESNR